MTALTTERLTKRRAGEQFEGPAAADAVIFSGALVCRNAAGDIVRGSTATGLKACGVATASVNNTGGSAGERSVPFMRGVFAFANDAADAITKADIENTCFITNDQTVCRTNGSNTKSAAGRIVDLNAEGVWVRIG
jgi:hypothetical protein